MRKFAAVVTMARRDSRRSADNTGTLEATSASSAAWLAGSGLLAATWPGQLDRALRQDWLDQRAASPGTSPTTWPAPAGPP